MDQKAKTNLNNKLDNPTKLRVYMTEINQETQTRISSDYFDTKEIK
jgi:hypothetical protein